MTEKNNRVIILNGTGGTGKDTFVNECNKLNYRVIHTSMISDAKRVARYCGYKDTKSEKDRKFLSDIMDAMTAWNDLPYKYVCKFIFSCKNKIIFVDARTPSDIERLKNKFNAITVFIRNKRVKPINSNHADRDVEDFAYDYIIENNGSIKTLKNSAIRFLTEIGEEIDN